MHLEEECAIEGCQNKIRVCCNVHMIIFDDNSRRKMLTPVVCIECPDHGRCGKFGILYEHAVVGVRGGKVSILKTGTDMLFEAAVD
jgi:hypothetical protein